LIDNGQEVPTVPDGTTRLEDWESRSVQRQLDHARRLLQVIEEQAAAYTTLTIPAELQVRVENERAKVAVLQQRLVGEAPPLRLKEAPDWTGDRSLQEIMDYLSLFCEPALVKAVMTQVILAPTYRRSFRWDMALSANQRRRRPADEALNALLRYSFEQIAPAHIDEAQVRTFAVYHIPSQLSEKGRLDRMHIEPEGSPEIDLVGADVQRYAERSAYGTFYRVPYTLRRGQAATVAAEVSAFHPVRSEEILVTYYPCTDYTATVRLPIQDVDRFALRVEFWHPSRPGEWRADEVHTQDGFQVSTYRIEEPLLPYQGLRIAWDYR
jgi:hypothetical protein